MRGSAFLSERVENTLRPTFGNLLFHGSISISQQLLTETYTSHSLLILEQIPGQTVDSAPRIYLKLLWSLSNDFCYNCGKFLYRLWGTTDRTIVLS